MSSIRFAFIGPTRQTSPWLLRALAQAGTLEAICDQHADREASRYHARWTFSDVDTMLREAEPDGVVVHLPLAARAAAMKACLSAGRDVLVTAAPGDSSACKRIMSLCRLTSRRILAAPAIRFAPALLLARRLIDSGKFGAPVSMRLCSTWRGSSQLDPSREGPVGLDQVFEAVDLVHQLIGPIHQTCAYAHAEGVVSTAALAGKTTPISMMFHSCGTADTLGVEMEIRSADGTSLRIDRDLRLTCGDGVRTESCHQVSLSALEPTAELGYDGLVTEFRRMAQADRPNHDVVAHAWGVVVAAEAVLASAERGRPVSPKYPSELSPDG